MEYRKLFHSFVNAFRGIIYTVRSERNMRIHLVCTAYMFYFISAYDFFEVSRTQLAILLLATALVIGGELINTAVERAVDTATNEFSWQARASKDASAGAVLIFAIFAVLTGIVILWQPLAFQALFEHYKSNPLYILAFAASVVVFSLFIFLPGVGKNKSDNPGATEIDKSNKKGKFNEKS